MAIPAVPSNPIVQQGNRQVYVSWDIAVGATSYSVQRSTDGVTYATVGTPAINNYLDTAVTIGTMYYYQVAAVNVSGTSPYTTPIQVVPAPTAELSLYEIRQRSQQRADRQNSQFVTTNEWNFFINQAMYELYDLLIAVYEDYFLAPRARFIVQGQPIFSYPLPDGLVPFMDQNNNTFIPAPFYKLIGVDLSLNTAANAFVTVNHYETISRNNFVYPNTASTIYGVFNLQYHVFGNNIEFIPTPSANQVIQLLYIPRLPDMLKDTDISTLGFSGWLQYAIIRAAKYALDKEESPTDHLDSELLFLKTRIEEMANNRDAGEPHRISNVRQNGEWGSMSGGYGWSGPLGGF